MKYKIGKYFIYHKDILDFVELICEDLKITKPKLYVINTKYHRRYLEELDNYYESYSRTNTIEVELNPPKMNLYYYDKDFNLNKYMIKDIEEDSAFLGNYHLMEKEIFLNLGLIYLDTALICLAAKKKGYEKFSLTEKKLNLYIKRTIMHECYHHYQNLNHLNLECWDADTYAINNSKRFKEFKLIREGISS